MNLLRAIRLPFALLATAAATLPLAESRAEDLCITAERDGNVFFPRVSPTGDLVCYCLGDKEGIAIWVSKLDGSEARRVTPPLMGALYPKWSRDGTRVGFRSYSHGGNHLWHVSADGGELTRVSDGATCESYDWSPDGKRFVWSSYRGSTQNLWISSAEGGQPRRLTGSTQESMNPQWSPSGDVIVFRRYGDDNMALWAISPEGGDERRLTKSGLRYEIPIWSPDGTRLVAVARNGRDEPMGIWMIDVEGNETQLVADGDFHYSPAWAPDGKSVFFQSNRLGQPGIWQVDVNTRELKRALGDGIGYDAFAVAGEGSEIVYQRGKYTGGQFFYDVETGARSPVSLGGAIRVSADGRWAAYQSYRSGNQDIWALPLDKSDGEPVQITRYPGADHDPSWSPDGKRVAYVSDAATQDIWIASLEGGEPELLVGGPREEFQPMWSPDGRFIAFSSDRGDGGPSLWLCRVEDKSIAPVAEGRFVWVHSWSPDGASIVYTAFSEELGNPELHRYWVDSGEREIVAGGGYAFRGVFSPDAGSYVYEHMNDEVDLYLRDFESGSTVQLTDDPGFESSPVWSGDGRFLYFSTATGLFRRDGQTGERQAIFDAAKGRRVLWSNADGSRILFQEDESKANLYVARIEADPKSIAAAGER